MRIASLQSIVEKLEAAEVRYLVAGGLAVIAHGYTRLTLDVDVILNLERRNVERAIEALAGLGYRPRPPVEMRDFADPEKRREWIEEKGLAVFSLWSPDHPGTDVDVFVEEPLPFDEAFERSLAAELAPGTSVRFVGRDDLIAMKKRAGRPKDLLDVDYLERIDKENDEA